MMKTHYIHPTGVALAGTSAVLYTLCAIVVAVWPMQAMRFFNDWMHGVDLTIIAKTPSLTFWSFAQGLVSIVITAYLVGALFAWLYQKCEAHCFRKRWIR